MSGNDASTSRAAVVRRDEEGVATLTLNRPEQLNLLTGEMIDALAGALAAIAADESVRVVVLAAAGRAFSAGHDLKEIRALGSKDEIEALFARCSRMMVAIPRLPQPVIARVHGPAAAAGCQLVAQCDLAVASSDATFTTPGVNWGFFGSTPGVAVGRNLPRKHAMEMLLTGDTIDADKALLWGLVNSVVAAEELDDTVSGLARKLAAKPPQSVAAGKRAFYEQIDLGLENAYRHAADVMAGAFAGNEGRAGIDAFVDRRSKKKS
jgi:enoyl-CoA hydratase/carnithine racemase